MGILDELIEKKDLRIYIDTRIIILQDETKRAIESAPEKERNGLRERFNGRIKELCNLLDTIEQGKLKEKDKAYWRQIERKAIES